MLHLKKRKRLLDAVEVKFEIFLLEISDRATLKIVGHHVERNEVRVDLDYLVRLLLVFGKHLPRALRFGIGFLRAAGQDGRAQQNYERQKNDQVACAMRLVHWNFLQV